MLKGGGGGGAEGPPPKKNLRFLEEFRLKIKQKPPIFGAWNINNDIVT